MHPLILSLSLLVCAPDLTPFLVGTSHPEIERPAPSENEQRALKSRILGLLQLPHPPGVQETRDLANAMVAALRRRELGYIDAAYAFNRMRDTLSIPNIEEKTMKDVVRDLRGRFDDTPLTGDTRREILRGVREVLSSAKNELP